MRLVVNYLFGLALNSTKELYDTNRMHRVKRPIRRVFHDNYLNNMRSKAFQIQINSLIVLNMTLGHSLTGQNQIFKSCKNL